MKVLLDENLDHRMRRHLGDHDVSTVRYMGWSGLKNGSLLQTAEDAGFQVFMTGDQTLRYEQDLVRRSIAVIVLSAIEWRLVRNYLSDINAVVERASAGSFQSVDCGTFRRGADAGQ